MDVVKSLRSIQQHNAQMAGALKKISEATQDIYNVLAIEGDLSVGESESEEVLDLEDEAELSEGEVERLKAEQAERKRKRAEEESEDGDVNMG